MNDKLVWKPTVSITRDRCFYSSVQIRLNDVIVANRSERRLLNTERSGALRRGQTKRKREPRVPRTLPGIRISRSTRAHKAADTRGSGRYARFGSFRANGERRPWQSAAIKALWWNGLIAGPINYRFLFFIFSIFFSSFFRIFSFFSDGTIWEKKSIIL